MPKEKKFKEKTPDETPGKLVPILRGSVIVGWKRE